MTTTRRIALLVVLAALAITPAAQAISPTTTRVVSTTGAQLNGDTTSSDVSRDGRWVAFSSTSTNILTGAPTVRQIYLADRVTGAVQMVSKAADGTPGNGRSTQPTISADGRFVAFQSIATNLASGATNTFDDAFLFDRMDGSLRRLSTSLTGGDANDWARDPQLSADGSTVVFTSPASNLVPGDTNFIDVFVAPTAGGPLQRISAKPDGSQANGTSVNGDASDNGRFIVFATDASDIAPGDTNAKRDIVVIDRDTNQRTRADVTSAGGEANGDANYPQISANGCFVVFNATATNLVAGDDKTAALKTFVRDRCQGSTEFASLRNDGTQGSVSAVPPQISDDGCTVAMLSATLTATPGVVLRDRCQGATLRADLSTAGELGNGAIPSWPRLSAGTGRFVTFDSLSTNLVPGDTNAASDVFVRDRANALAPTASLDLKVDAAGRVVADASASADPDGRIVSAKIGWGDGTPEDSGLTATHAYTRGGAFTVTLIVTDSDGLTATATRNVTVGGGDDPGTTPGTTVTPGGPLDVPTLPRGAVKPSLTAVKLSRSTFAAAPAHGTAKGKQGAKLTLTANTAAKLTLRFERIVKGHKAGGKCSPTAHHGARCTAYKAGGTATASLRAGANNVALSGRIGSRALAAGRYRLTLTARTADGRTSSALTRTITITKEHN